MSDLIHLKTHRNSNYSTISLTAVHDPRLTLKAKGLHTYLISRPPGWKVYKADLLNRTRTGKDALNSAMEELKVNGYLKMQRLKDVKGQYKGWTWEVYEEPQTLNTSQIKPKAGKSVFRVTRITGNPPHSNNNSTNHHFKSSSPTPPVVEEEKNNIATDQLPQRFAGLDERTLARLAQACKDRGLDLTKQAKALVEEYSRAGIIMNSPAGALMSKIKEGGVVKPEELVEAAKEAMIKLEKERKRVRDAHARAEIPRWER